jgi:hypothetical protein
MEIPFIASFRGQDADRHRLPAIDGTESLVGIARGLQIISNYAVEGRIRRKLPFSDSVKIELAPSRAGSFETLFNIIVNTDVDSATIFIAGAAQVALSAMQFMT